MKLTAKRLTQLVERLVGTEGMQVLDLVRESENVSEFDIAKKIKKDIQMTRNILYRLHHHDLVFYKRVKDRKKGWYIGYWTFNKTRAKELFISMQKKELKRYQDRLSEELANFNNFFLCKNMCARMNFENAASVEFRCPECGSVMDQQENHKTVELLKEKISVLTPVNS